ncbi:MAG: hypothetical protein QXO37_09500 [Candidatus Nitrosocaldaceae archaeon]
MSIYMTYVGKKAYPSDTEFIDEGLRKKASRACSFNILKHLVMNDAIIYYARYEDELVHKYSRVFAKGKVIGFSTTLDLASVGVNTKGLAWHREDRGCGTYYACSAYVDDIRPIVENIDKKAREDKEYAIKVASSKWFILTDIERYESIITHLIDYTRYEIIPYEISFSRGFILLAGKGGKDRARSSKDIVMQIKRYRLYDKIEHNDKERERKIKSRQESAKILKLDAYMDVR